MNRFDLSLYLVTDRSLALNRSLEYVVKEAAEASERSVTRYKLKSKRFIV
jgi:thiamine-phosphate pyrophosphorylase